MQFAGQRTDADLNPAGEPINVMVTLTEEVLPEPGAVLITGITPQKTQQEGMSEADFVRLLHEQVFTPNTTVMGFNSVRFDDEFVRYTLYRNFYDPYEWAWQDGRSRWDMLDVVRMTRALRPDGIVWPFTEEGQPINRLELLSSVNGLDHTKAHDALSDVVALIGVTKLIKQKQPKLFDYLLKVRDKKEVAKLVNLDDPQPFVYTSGRYPKETLHTTIAYPIAPGGKPGSVIVYDLRHDPTDWAAMSVAELRDARFANYEQRQMEGFVALPAKELSYNKCPAVAPVGVLDQSAQERIKIDIGLVQKHLAILRRSDLGDKLRQVFTAGEFPRTDDVDAQLYDGFMADRDKTKLNVVRNASAADLADLHPDFADERLPGLLLRYKARNYPQSLSQDERVAWEAYRTGRLQRDMPKYMQTLQSLATQAQTTSSHFLIEELQLWAQSIAPLD